MFSRYAGFLFHLSIWLFSSCSSSTFKDPERASLRDSGHGDSDQADSDQDTNKGSCCDMSAKEALKMKASGLKPQPLEQGKSFNIKTLIKNWGRRGWEGCPFSFISTSFLCGHDTSLVFVSPLAVIQKSSTCFSRFLAYFKWKLLVLLLCSKLAQLMCLSCVCLRLIYYQLVIQYIQELNCK